jgi:hypothetical protein
MNFIVKRMARKGPNKSSCRKQSAQVVLKCCQQGESLIETPPAELEFLWFAGQPEEVQPDVTRGYSLPAQSQFRSTIFWPNGQIMVDSLRKDLTCGTIPSDATLRPAQVSKNQDIYRGRPKFAAAIWITIG